MKQWLKENSWIGCMAFALSVFADIHIWNWEWWFIAVPVAMLVEWKCR